jgi:hypothetical protein
MTSPLIGQWRGTSKSGSVCIVNIDQDGLSISGRVSVFESVPIEGRPFPIWSWSYLLGEVNSDGSISGHVKAPSIHKQYGEFLTDEEINYLKDKIKFEFPNSTTFVGARDGKNKLIVNWESKYPSVPDRLDTVHLKREQLIASKIIHKEMDWNEFREFALMQPEGLIYRGQAQKWMLQTAFHRTGRADLISYLDNQVPDLERHINSVSEHVFDSNNDRSLGALLNLAQHHGYPTPLLDWTKSPYVAAFFAFEDISQIKKDKPVSIFIFEERKWSNMAGRTAQLRVPNMVVRTLELPGFGNARVLPQQSVTMYSNMANIESIILSNETNSGDFVKAVAIPSSDREKAMRDLALMGITWGSLFPGLDGICRQLRSRHFGQ